MAPTNNAALIPSPRAHPMTVGPAEYPTVGEGELVVKVSAVAINPMDWYIQLMGEQLFPFLKYPYIGGTDVVGTVVEVGAGVTKFKSGDKVVALAPGFDTREGAFQEYVVVRPNVAFVVPEGVNATDASVLPLGVATAAAGLYQKDFLGLDYPKVNPEPKGETLLIWAGASSVGTNAIQLAVASGYEVITTSSPKNFDYCQKLGATQVFDYKSPSITQDLLDAFKGKTCAGAVAIQMGAELPCFEVVAKSKGTKKFVSCAMPVPEDKVPEGVQAKMIFGGTVAANEVGPIVFNEFLPAALRQNKFQALPKTTIVGHGLESIQDALDKGKAGGLSAQKMVVTL